MKKIVLALAVTMMTATYSVATYAAVSSKVTVNQDDKKKKKEATKACCKPKGEASSSHCAKEAENKACCKAKSSSSSKSK